jgi:hypothetical protein
LDWRKAAEGKTFGLMTMAIVLALLSLTFGLLTGVIIDRCNCDSIDKLYPKVL